MSKKEMVPLVLFLAASAGRAVAQQDAPEAGKVVLGVSAAEIDAVAVGYRASKLIGATVYNDKREKIGKVGDLVIQPDGTVSLAIVDVGGFLGLDERHVAIPVSQFSDVNPRVVLPGATKEALKALPPFQYTK
jgi:sporulation protein YlmC with PRC-barrel domain